MQVKMSFMVLEIWLFGFGNVLEIFLKEFLRTLSSGHGLMIMVVVVVVDDRDKHYCVDHDNTN